ncbi:gephyrin-like molybdotransferase receptor GlpR [Streptomyces phaeofaciens]|uniref:gephyrin-like molybdotransferase receptor GlpR n=1 Tax=Streptomyces phaeofaciens TaxID=68254 RepID=UPI0036B376B3
MSSSGLIYAVIVGAWAAYLVPMWLRRQDELNEARPTERFSTAIRLLSGRAGMERRYAKDLRARSTEEGESGAEAPDGLTGSVDVRAFAMPPTRPQATATIPERAGQDRAGQDRGGPGRPDPARDAAREQTREQAREPVRDQAREAAARDQSARPGREQPHPSAARGDHASSGPTGPSAPAHEGAAAPAPQRVPAARRTPAAQAAAARAQRTKALARRRRTTVMLFVAFTLGAVVAAVGGLAFLWAPGVPAVLLSAYIAYLRAQEHRRFAYQMDRRRAEVAAQRLRERQPRRRAPSSASVTVETGLDAGAEEPHAGPEPETDPGLLALAADRRALVEQTDHAEWVDQQRERQRRPGQGDSWDPVPVPLPTYVTAPVAPRATSDVDLGAPDAWSSARSSTVTPEQDAADGAGERDAEDGADGEPGDADPADGKADGGKHSGARRAASARRARERGRTPLFDQYEDGERPRAANE